MSQKFKGKYGSKKKMRRAQFKVREAKRDEEKKRIEKFNKSTDIEEMSRLLGIPLK